MQVFVGIIAITDLKACRFEHWQFVALNQMFYSITTVVQPSTMLSSTKTVSFGGVEMYIIIIWHTIYVHLPSRHFAAQLCVSPGSYTNNKSPNSNHFQKSNYQKATSSTTTTTKLICVIYCGHFARNTQTIYMAASFKFYFI